MATLLRQGNLGTYWGSEYNSSRSLTASQQRMNADYIYRYFTSKGWTVNAIAGILGNMQSESAINPGRWQSNNVGNMSGGYGLVQWTPATKYINWVGLLDDPSTMDNNLARITYELEHNLQWISTSSYPLSFQEFTQSYDSAYNLGMAFVTNYERPAHISTQRGVNAEKWYQYLMGIVPVEISSKRKGFRWVLYANKLRERNN